MKKALSILVLFCLVLFCTAQNKKHNEIRDLGYIGKVYSVATKVYRDSLDNKSIDSLISTQTRYYNKEGNATKDQYQKGSYSNTVDYEYKNGIRKGFTITTGGEIKMKAKIAEQKTGYQLDIYDLQNRLSAKNVYQYDNNSKVKNYESIKYNNQTGEVKSRTLNSYYRDSDGFIEGYDIKDLIKPNTDRYRFKTIEKDLHKNPKKRILLKNNLKFQIHVIDIEYYK